MGKGPTIVTAQSVPSDADGRIVVLEHRVGNLEDTVSNGFREMGSRFDKLANNLASRPITPPFKEIMLSIGATLTVVMIVAGVIGGYVERSIALSAANMSAEQRIMMYRIEQIEKRAAAQPHGMVMLAPRQ